MSSISSATVRCLEGNAAQNAEEQAGQKRPTRLPAPPASPTSACWPPASSSNSGSSQEKLGRRSVGQSTPVSLSCKSPLPKGARRYAPRAGVVRYDHVAFACAVFPASNLCAVLRHASRQAPRGPQGTGQGRAGQGVPALRAAVLRSKPTTYLGSAAFSRLPVAARTTKSDNSQRRCAQLALATGGARQATCWPRTKRDVRRVCIVGARP